MLRPACFKGIKTQMRYEARSASRPRTGPRHTSTLLRTVLRLTPTVLRGGRMTGLALFKQADATGRILRHQVPDHRECDQATEARALLSADRLNDVTGVCRSKLDIG